MWSGGTTPLVGCGRLAHFHYPQLNRLGKVKVTHFCRKQNWVGYGSKWPPFPVFTNTLCIGPERRNPDTTLHLV